MTDDLRALAERVVGGHRGRYTVLAEHLAGHVLTLLTSLEAREVELRMLGRSNTVLNERLEAAEKELGVVHRESKMHYEWYLGACGARDLNHTALTAAEQRAKEAEIAVGQNNEPCPQCASRTRSLEYHLRYRCQKCGGISAI